MSVTVKTQAELDAALASGEASIIIDSPRGAWLSLGKYGSATVRAYGSATVRASGSATVEAYDSATVRASGSATVRAYDSATVRAYDSATVEASSHVAVHLHSARATITGGVVIDVSALDLTDPTIWAEHSGADIDGGYATVFKAVDAHLNAGQDHTLTAYPIGSTVAAPDWKPTADCGHGLHFGATPHHANRYYRGGGPARYLECRVALDTLVPLGDKCKAPSCEVVREVDVMGRPLGFEQLTA